jgi:two-component system cell cycle sensor histidine kinase/response regulator CckA
MVQQYRVHRNFAPLIDQTTRPVAIGRTLIIGAVLIASAAVLGFFRNRLDEPIFVGILGIFAIIGFFYLFGSALGFIQLASREENDAFSRALLDSAATGLVICDDRGRIVYANRAYGEMTGATSAADLKSVDALLSQEDEAAHVLYKMTNLLRDGRHADEEFRLTRSLSGKREGARWYRVKGRALEVPGARKPYFVWDMADISQERAEQERFFQDLQQAIDHLDHAPAGFFSADSDWRLVYLNATLADWLGIDLANFTSGELSVPQIIAGDGMALLRSIKAEPGETRSATVDLDLEKRNGEILPVRVLHSVTANRQGVMGASRTIVLSRTGGQEAGADLYSAEMRFNRFFNSAPMAIAGVNRDGRIVRANARFMSLFSGLIDRDTIDRRIRFDTVVHERDREKLAKALEAAVDKRAEIEPVDSVLPQDEQRHIRFYVSATADSGGAEKTEEAAIVYTVETTEQKALEGQMAQSQKMQAVGQLAGGIAHDFNNVLTAIIMASDLLLSNHRPSDPSFPDIMNIKNNANRAASLVRQLLAFSRRQTLRPQVLELTDVMADLRMLLARLAGNDVKLTVEHGRSLWPVKVDIGQLEQVIVNLVVNARDAMPDGGDISIRTANVMEQDCADFGYREMEAANYVLIEVEDTGTGIPADIKAKIFEPFFTTKEVGKGTGLGLSMVYGIIKQTGGYIFCDSEVGKGTVFRIFLPRHIQDVGGETGVQETVAETAAKLPDAARDLSGTATVLLVEDEDAVRMGGVRALTSRGYTVHEASSGAEALEKFNELDGTVDIIVSDVVMPEMDGPTLLREVRKIQPDIKFIFVSGYAEDAFAKNLPAEAKFGFLPKPFSLKQLASAVKEMLESE